MTKIYIIRHAQSEGNREKTFQGLENTPLSAKGEIQLETLQRFFADIPLNKIYTSPLLRATQTAQAVRGKQTCPIEKQEKLIELNMGLWQGHTYNEVKLQFPRRFKNWEKHLWLLHTPKGESVFHLSKRVRHCFQQIIKENENQTVAIVSHGCAIRTLMCHIENRPLYQLNRIPLPGNASVIGVKYEKGKFVQFC